MISLEYLKEILDYNPSTGVFIWKIDRNKMKIGQNAGSKVSSKNKKSFYWSIKIDGKSYKAHILSWFYITEEWPSKQIDHINGIKYDNRFENLRLATNSQNQGNRTRSKNNTSGYKGVSWIKAHQKYRVKVGSHHFGYFNSIEEAAKVYDEAALKHFGKFAFVNERIKRA